MADVRIRLYLGPADGTLVRWHCAPQVWHIPGPIDDTCFEIGIYEPLPTSPRLASDQVARNERGELIYQWGGWVYRELRATEPAPG